MFSYTLEALVFLFYKKKFHFIFIRCSELFFFNLKFLNHVRHSRGKCQIWTCVTVLYQKFGKSFWKRKYLDNLGKGRKIRTTSRMFLEIPSKNYFKTIFNSSLTLIFYVRRNPKSIPAKLQSQIYIIISILSYPATTW